LALALLYVHIVRDLAEEIMDGSSNRAGDHHAVRAGRGSRASR